MARKHWPDAIPMPGRPPRATAAEKDASIANSEKQVCGMRSGRLVKYIDCSGETIIARFSKRTEYEPTTNSFQFRTARFSRFSESS